MIEDQFTVRARMLFRSWNRMPENVRGIVAMLGAMAAFSFGDALMKLAADRFPTGEAIFLRGLMSMAAIWWLASRLGALSNVHLLRMPYLPTRTWADVAASLLFIAALGRIPLADASAILQTNPLAVTAGAALFLGENVGWRRWTATAVGLLGVLMIIQPGSSAFSWASLLVIGAVIASAVRDLVTRKLPAIPTVLVTAAAVTATTLASLVLLPFETWTMPRFLDLVVLAIAGTCVLAGQFLVITSIRAGDVSAVVPFRYSAIVWSLLLSFIIWHHLPNALTMLGIVVVSGAGLYTFYREEALKRQGKFA